MIDFEYEITNIIETKVFILNREQILDWIAPEFCSID